MTGRRFDGMPTEGTRIPHAQVCPHAVEMKQMPNAGRTRPLSKVLVHSKILQTDRTQNFFFVHSFVTEVIPNGIFVSKSSDELS